MCLYNSVSSESTYSIYRSTAVQRFHFDFIFFAFCLCTFLSLFVCIIQFQVKVFDRLTAAQRFGVLLVLIIVFLNRMFFAISMSG